MQEKRLKYKCLIIKNSSNKIFGAFPNSYDGRSRARLYMEKLKSTHFDKFRVVKE